MLPKRLNNLDPYLVIIIIQMMLIIWLIIRSTFLNLEVENLKNTQRDQIRIINNILTVNDRSVKLIEQNILAFQRIKDFIMQTNDINNYVKNMCDGKIKSTP